MLISGIQPFTLLDYPGKTACVIFLPGCNFRCGYCHNKEFVLPEKIKELQGNFIDEEVVYNFLINRRELLDGAVISGGEPTMMPDLVPFLQKIRRLGFSVKLDTNGNRPDVITKALELRTVDYIAMDLKTDLPTYTALVGNGAKKDALEQSISILLNSPIDYEFRSTIIKEVHSDAVLEKMAQAITGAKHWYLQNFRPENTLAPHFANYHPFEEAELKTIAERLSPYVHKITVRA